MHYIQIVEKNNSAVCVLQMEANSQRETEQIQRGAAINLNHDDFKIVISGTPLNIQNTEL